MSQKHEGQNRKWEVPIFKHNSVGIITDFSDCCVTLTTSACTVSIGTADSICGLNLPATSTFTGTPIRYRSSIRLWSTGRRATRKRQRPLPLQQWNVWTLRGQQSRTCFEFTKHSHSPLNNTTYSRSPIPSAASPETNRAEYGHRRNFGGRRRLLLQQRRLNVFRKGPQPLLWAGSRTAHLEIVCLVHPEDQLMSNFYSTCTIKRIFIYIYIYIYIINIIYE